jgi:hypothetical protein
MNLPNCLRSFVILNRSINPDPAAGYKSMKKGKKEAKILSIIKNRGINLVL